MFSGVCRQEKWWRAIHTFKPVSVLWAQVLLLSMATSWLPSKSFRVTLCWFDFTFVCSLFGHNNLPCRLRINWEARRNMVTDKHREDYVSVTGSHGYQGRTLTLEKWIIISLFFPESEKKVNRTPPIYWLFLIRTTNCVYITFSADKMDWIHERKCFHLSAISKSRMMCFSK